MLVAQVVEGVLEQVAGEQRVEAELVEVLVRVERGVERVLEAGLVVAAGRVHLDAQHPELDQHFPEVVEVLPGDLGDALLVEDRAQLAGGEADREPVREAPDRLRGVGERAPVRGEDPVDDHPLAGLRADPHRLRR